MPCLGACNVNYCRFLTFSFGSAINYSTWWPFGGGFPFVHSYESPWYIPSSIQMQSKIPIHPTPTPSRFYLPIQIQIAPIWSVSQSPHPSFRSKFIQIPISFAQIFCHGQVTCLIFPWIQVLWSPFSKGIWMTSVSIHIPLYTHQKDPVVVLSNHGTIPWPQKRCRKVCHLAMAVRWYLRHLWLGATPIHPTVTWWID